MLNIVLSVKPPDRDPFSICLKNDAGDLKQNMKNKMNDDKRYQGESRVFMVSDQFMPELFQRPPI